jgi:hypothetical protein
MSHALMVRSFADLPLLFAAAAAADRAPAVTDIGADEADDAFSLTRMAGPPIAPEPTDNVPDLAGLLTQLEAASATLMTVARQDGEARLLALRDLEQYDALVAQQREAEATLARAQQVRREAEEFLAAAFADEARAAAERVAALAAQAEQAARQLAEQRQTEAAALARRLDLERLLAARQREEEARQARAAEAERARRLTETLTAVRAALAAGHLEEAGALLGPVANEYPDNADIASLTAMIAQREFVVKASVAEDALRQARRLCRQQPAAAVALLEPLDLADLPTPLARQVFGAWAQACGRLCRERDLAAPLRYAPDPGRGLVLARDDDGQYVVVSALGMGPRWQPGTPVPEPIVRRARPLK